MPPERRKTPPKPAIPPLCIPTLDEDVLWDVNAVAAYLGVEPATVSSYQYGQAGSIPPPADNPQLLISDRKPITDAIGALLHRAGGTAPLRLWRASHIIHWHTNRTRAGIGGRRKDEDT